MGSLKTNQPFIVAFCKPQNSEMHRPSFGLHESIGGTCIRFSSQASRWQFIGSSVLPPKAKLRQQRSLMRFLRKGRSSARRYVSSQRLRKQPTRTNSMQFSNSVRATFTGKACLAIRTTPSHCSGKSQRKDTQRLSTLWPCGSNTETALSRIWLKRRSGIAWQPSREIPKLKAHREGRSLTAREYRVIRWKPSSGIGRPRAKETKPLNSTLLGATTMDGAFPRISKRQRPFGLLWPTRATPTPRTS